ncbi:MAG: Obg family GTPase CgtA [Candidatus Omnitrophica bacterium]|nr:Obg family GTPase CgtA [Candidatus Omnitrophota bacterium]MDD5355433.1 Obg family GTPase CgtA [Candidatus Omnitrophota bacterium]
MFIDRVKIVVKGGNGGDGCRSFYSDKMNCKKKPDGGNGGNGGSIVLKASRNVFTLLDFKYRHEFAAGRGRHGSGNTRKGKEGKDIVVLVPLGTQIFDEPSACLLEDLDKEGKEIVIARGGRGGWGNHERKEATPGRPGEVKTLVLDLKLIADVGIIGFPNAGKSTLISRLSSARPQIAAYPFTTKEPVLGVVNVGDDSFTIVDIPGLIEGAHLGKGLGDKFLRHVERTKVLVHIVDMAGVDTRDPLVDYETLNKELEFYSREILSKPQVLVANKIDLEPAKENLERFKARFKKRIIGVSAKDNINLDVLIGQIYEKVKKVSS